MKIRIAVTPPASALREAALGACLGACGALGFDTVRLYNIPPGPNGDPLIAPSTRRDDLDRLADALLPLQT